jgi:probable DNA metabolism protein
MTDLVYDGSFDGFLCAARRALAEPGARIVPADDRGASTDLFAEVVPVPTEGAEAGRLRDRIVTCAGAEELLTLRYVHASAAPARHRLLLLHVARTLAEGRSVQGDATDPVVRAVREIRDRVSLEIARFLGFARFRRVGADGYYAPINPDADIVGFVGPHFADRFPGQALVVHDVNRDVAFWSARGARGIADLAGLPPGVRERLATDCEPVIEELWRAFFEQTANPERRNRRLQRKLLPERYQALMVERPGVRPTTPPDRGCTPGTLRVR